MISLVYLTLILILKELQSAGSAGEFYTPRAVIDFMAEMIKPQIGETMAENCTTSLIQVAEA